MNATQTHVRIGEYVSTVIIRTHVSVRVDILVTTAKRVSNRLPYAFIEHFIHGNLLKKEETKES